MNSTRTRRKRKNRATKINLIFDEEKRRQFLSGFHKRKLQRKQKAKEQLDKDLKEEKKRLKQEAKESYRNMLLSQKSVPEIENLVSQEYEEDDVQIKVIELSTNEIAKQNNWIGPNQLKYEAQSDQDANDSDDNKNVPINKLPGMELPNEKSSSDSKPVVKKQETKEHFSDIKQLKKQLKKQATKNVKKSKIFQRKNKQENRKQKKKSRQLKHRNESFKEKSMKKRRKN